MAHQGPSCGASVFCAASISALSFDGAKETGAETVAPPTLDGGEVSDATLTGKEEACGESVASPTLGGGAFAIP